MVKANAYGHHLNLVTPLLENADILAVSEIQEAQALRQITNKPILLLSRLQTASDSLDDCTHLHKQSDSGHIQY
jgi:alanine racemase